ncbi:MAG TPA: ABC transporter substrate-binding protein [Chloroflexota bacterium]|nr:ABC transporter substrate-binding protein [Chloroflexota bacterium]
MHRSPMALSRRQFVQAAGAASLGWLAGCAARVAPAAPPAQPPRVGVLAFGSPGQLGPLEAFEHGLTERGYDLNSTLSLEYRFAEGKPERFPALAAELVGVPVDLILAASSPAIQAAMQATQTIPIVMAVSAEPVEQGFVASLARPGGNVTGLTSLSLQLSQKRLEVLRDALPEIARVAVLWDPMYPGKRKEFAATAEAAQRLGLELQSTEVQRPDQFEAAFADIARERADAVVVLGGPLFQQQHPRLAALALDGRLPSMFETPQLLAGGGLLAYGPNNDDLFAYAASYVERILKGARPEELPVEQPTRFYLAVNLRTARALGITLPRETLLNATMTVE